MKKKLLLFILFLCCTLCSRAQVTNATGSDTFLISRSVGNGDMSSLWEAFVVVPQFPAHATIVNIYPVVVVSYVKDATTAEVSYGTNLTLHNIAGTAITLPIGSFSSTELFGASIGTSLSALNGMQIRTQLNSSLDNPIPPGCTPLLTDDMETTAVGFAIYYTSTTPVIDSTIPPPFTVPSGQGLAWAFPSLSQQIGVQPGICSFFSQATGQGLAAPAQFSGTQKLLSGEINNPDGTGINGFLRVSLPNGTIKNICSTPNLIVPKFSTTFKVINGAPQFGSATLTSNDCLYPRVVYNIEVDDAQNNLKYQDNWYLPESTDISYDIGNLSQLNYGGPITVSVPKGIISNPAVSQSITQPPGTSLSLNGTIVINGVTFATAAGGVTYTGLVQTNPILTQIVTQPSGTFLNLVGDIRINGSPFAAGVVSFNGRSGAVSPTTGDYSCAMISGAICSLGSVNYQTMQTNTTPVPVENALNFSSSFSLADTSGVRTTVSLASTGVGATTYTFPSSITVNQAGQITAISSAGTLPVNVTQVIATGSRTFNTIFQNTSSSAMLATGYGTTSGSSTGQISCLTGGTNPPTTLIWSNQVTATVSSGHAGFMCLVPAGQFGEVTVSGAISTTPGAWVESTF